MKRKRKYSGQRWQFEESLGVNPVRNVDRLMHADISSWAHATSKPFGSQFKPRRPNEDKAIVLESYSRNVKSLNLIGKVDSAPAKHDPASVVIPVKDKKTVDLSDVNIADTIKARAASVRNRLNDNFNQVYSDPSANLKSAGEELVVKVFEGIKSVPKTDTSDQPSWFRELQRQNQVSRSK